MRDRTRAILETSVRDFIREGRPITSEWLYEEYDFGIKPAMIRWELNELGEAGYLSQLHHSGGRVPTNKAYRFLVNDLLEEDFGEADVWHGVHGLIREFLRGGRKNFVEEVAEELKMASVGYEPKKVEIYESGLHTLLDQLEIRGKEELVDVVRDIESIGERLENFNIEGKGPQVFIGQNPLVKSECLSIVAEKFDTPGQSFFLFAIGPKRMDYRRSLKFFWSIEKSLNDL
jgi:transcriptional regulator of heat shock response